VEGASANASEAVGVGLEDPLLRLEGGSRVRVRVSIGEARAQQSAPEPPRKGKS